MQIFELQQKLKVIIFLAYYFFDFSNFWEEKEKNSR